jgi:hypothetical protein
VRIILFILILIIILPLDGFTQFNCQEYCKERVWEGSDVDFACNDITESSEFLEEVLSEQNYLRIHYQVVRDSFNLVNISIVSQLSIIRDSIKLVDDKLEILKPYFNAYVTLQEITTAHSLSTRAYCKSASQVYSAYSAPRFKSDENGNLIVINGGQYVPLSEKEKEIISFSKIFGNRFIGHDKHVSHIISDSEDLKNITKIDEIKSDLKLIYYFKKDIRSNSSVLSTTPSIDYITHLSILSILVGSNGVEIKNATYQTKDHVYDGYSKEYKKIIKRIRNKKTLKFIGNDKLFNDSLLIELSKTEDFFNLKLVRSNLQFKLDSLFIEESIYSNKTIEEAIMKDSLKLETLISYYKEFPAYASNYIEEYEKVLELWSKEYDQYEKEYDQYEKDKQKLNTLYPKLKSFNSYEAKKTFNAAMKLLTYPLASPLLKDYGWYFNEDFSKWCPCIKLVWIEVNYREGVSNNSSGYEATKKYLCSIINGNLGSVWRIKDKKNDEWILKQSVQLSYLSDTPCNWIPHSNLPELPKFDAPIYKGLNGFYGFYDYTISPMEEELFRYR